MATKSGPAKLKTKRATSKKWRVDIIESERGWGSKLDETKTFRGKAAAVRFVKKFNAKNNLPYVPDWYMYARDPYQK